MVAATNEQTEWMELLQLQADEGRAWSAPHHHGGQRRGPDRGRRPVAPIRGTLAHRESQMRHLSIQRGLLMMQSR